MLQLMNLLMRPASSIVFSITITVICIFWRFFSRARHYWLLSPEDLSLILTAVAPREVIRVPGQESNREGK